MRNDAGRSQAEIAGAAGVSQAHLSTIESGNAEPSIKALLAVATALGADLSLRLFPGSGPRIRDHLQVAIGEVLLAILHPRWHRSPEVAVYRPIRGVIDLVLDDQPGRTLVATEIQSQLRRVEQQLRWSVQKADALAAMPEYQGRTTSRLLVLRNTVATREVVRSASATLAAAFPGRAADALASLRTDAPWPGPALLWAIVESGSARLMDGPPRGITVGR